MPACKGALLGPVAQSVEHLTFNQRVLGSSPSRPTKPKALQFYELQGFFVAPQRRITHSDPLLNRYGVVTFDRKNS